MHLISTSGIRELCTPFKYLMWHSKKKWNKQQFLHEKCKCMYYGPVLLCLSLSTFFPSSLCIRLVWGGSSQRWGTDTTPAACSTEETNVFFVPLCVLGLCEEVVANDEEQTRRLLPVLQKRLTEASSTTNHCLKAREHVTAWWVSLQSLRLYRPVMIPSISL